MNINIDNNMTADQAARTVRQLQARLGEKTREATMHWEMKKSAAGELSECKEVLMTTQRELRESEKRADEQELRAIKAEDEAIKHAKWVDELRAKEEQYQRDLNIVREEKFELQQAFNKLWSEYQELVQSTPKSMHPESTLANFAPKE